MNEFNEDQRQMLARLKHQLDSWKERRMGPVRIRHILLTNAQIDNFYSINEKRLTGKSLTGSERTEKSDAKLKMQNAFADIAQAIDIRGPSNRNADDSPLFSDKQWKEIIPLENITQLIRGLVKRLGEDYALQVAMEIGLGLQEHELRQNRITHIDVPIIKHAQSSKVFATKYGKAVKRKKPGRPKKKIDRRDVPEL
jgi:hypothetical protein